MSTSGNKKARKIMAIHLGRKLSIFEIIHHKDKNTNNNNIKNLEITTREKHTSFHHAGSKKNYPKNCKRRRKL